MRLVLGNTTKHFNTQKEHDRALRSISVPAALFKHLLVTGEKECQFSTMNMGTEMVAPRTQGTGTHYSVQESIQ